MRPLRIRVLLLLSLSALALAAACAAPGQPIDTGEPGSADLTFDATWSSGAFPALESENCGATGCHTAANQAGTGGLQLPDNVGTLSSSAAFNEIMAEAVVDTANPEASLLLTKGLGVGHGGLQQWAESDDSYQIVLAWISSGAQLN